MPRGRFNNRRQRAAAWASACLLVLGLAALAATGPAAAPAAAPPPARSGFAAGARYAPDHVVVKLRTGAGPAALRGERGIQSVFLSWYRVGVRPGETPDAAIARLRRLPALMVAERDYYARAFQAPNDPDFPRQWNFPMVQAHAAWSRSTGTGITVAVLDTGMSRPAGDFVAGHILGYASAYGTTDDLNGHGTHVSGTIAQATNNALGAAGLAYDANIRPVKVLSDAGSGLFSHVAQGIYSAALSGDRVINMSLGGPCAANWPACSTAIVNDAIQVAIDRDVVIVAASGNDDAPFVSFPANHPNILAVGAVNRGRSRASYSNFGCGLSLVAPGGETYPNAADGIYQQTYFNGALSVRPFQGTSMAAPHVAAAAAILLARVPGAHSEDVRAAILAAARDLGPPGRDDQYGAGLLRIDDALTRLNNGGAPPPPAKCGVAPLQRRRLTPPNKVDLRVVSVDAAAMTVDPQTFQLGGTASVTVANWGDLRPIPGYEITLFEDRNWNGSYDPSEKLATWSCNASACAIAPFGFARFTIPLAGTLAFRDQPIFAIVDAVGQIAESDETNNIGVSLGSCGIAAPITIQPTQKWYRQLGSMYLATPIVADLNQDRLPEVIVRDDDTIRVFSGRTGDAAPFFMPPIMNRGYAYHALAVGNIDSDPFLEIVAMEPDPAQPLRAYFISAFRHDGSLLWRRGPIEIVMVNDLDVWSPTIADLAHDGTPEVIAPGRILSGATGEVQAVLATGPAPIAGAAVAVNLDQDPELEIVIGNLAFNPGGTTFWANANPVGGYNAVVDFDGDGAPDIVHAPHIFSNAPVPSIMVYRGRDGIPLPGWTPPSIPHGGVLGPPAVADIDGDGHPEVAAVREGGLNVYRHDGSLRWSLPISEGTGSPGVSAFDFNQDGRWELVLNDQDRLMIVADIGGVPEVVSEISSFNGTGFEYPVVADVDGDGHAEIVTQTMPYAPTELRAYENVGGDWPATRAIWNQLPYHAENVGPGGQIPVSLPANWWADNQFLVNPQPAPEGGPDLTAGRILTRLAEVSALIGNAGTLAAGPVAVTFYDGDPAATGRAIGTATIASLPAGTATTVSISVAANFTGAHDIYVLADADQAFPECNENNNRHHLQVTIAPVDLAISKRVVPNPVVVGQPASYVLEISNPTAIDTQATVVRDELPAGVHATNISYAPANCGWASSRTGQQLALWRPGIPAHTTCVITIDFTISRSGAVLNEAELWDSLDAAFGNNRAGADHDVVDPERYDLRITNYAFNLFGPVERGQPLLYVILVENLGPVPATGPMRIVDRFEGNGPIVQISWHPFVFNILWNGGLDPISYLSPAPSPWTCSPAYGRPFERYMQCDRGGPPMQPGGEIILIWARVSPQVGSRISSTAALAGSNDANPANNQSNVISPVP